MSKSHVLQMNKSYIVYYWEFANETNFTKSAVGKQMKSDDIGPNRIYGLRH